MPQVQQTTQLRIGMAERYEIVIDFSKYAPGTKLQLLNLGVPNSTDFDNTGKVMQFEVVERRLRQDEQRPADRWSLLAQPQQGGLGPQGDRDPGHDQDRGRALERRVEDPEHSTSTTSNSGKGSSGSGGSGRQLGVGFVRRRHHQAAHLGGRHRLPVPGDGGEPGIRRRPDLGDHEQLRRLVPPGAHPPRRLQDAHPQRQAGVQLRAGPQGRRVRRARTRRSGRSCGSARQATRPRTAGT